MNNVLLTMTKPFQALYATKKRALATFIISVLVVATIAGYLQYTRSRPLNASRLNTIPANAPVGCKSVATDEVTKIVGADFTEVTDAPTIKEEGKQTSGCTFSNGDATLAISWSSYPDVERANYQLRLKADPENSAIKPSNDYGSHALFITNAPGNYTLTFQKNFTVINITTNNMGDAEVAEQKAQAVGANALAKF